MEKRVIIVDYNHMAFSYYFSPLRLSAKLTIKGQYQEKDTTVHTGTLKNVHRWTLGGAYPCAVCFDRPVAARKAFFESAFPDMKMGGPGEYKGGREKMPQDLFESIQECEQLLRSAGVSVFSAPNFEADDLIYACVKRAKIKYPGMPIDIITNDADLLPLVDHTVSVFLRSKKGTYAVEKRLEKDKYIQVTPENFQEVVEGLSAYKGFCIPYNTLLLYKLLRGDPSDNYRRKDISRKFPRTKYNAMIEKMIAEYVNFEEIFRYGDPQYKILYKGTDEAFEGTLEDAKKLPGFKDKVYMKISNSEELDAIIAILKMYTDMDEDMLSHIEKVYWGMNLNQTYPNENKAYARRGYELCQRGAGDIDTYDEMELRRVLSPLQINLKMY